MAKSLENREINEEFQRILKEEEMAFNAPVGTVISNIIGENVIRKIQSGEWGNKELARHIFVDFELVNDQNATGKPDVSVFAEVENNPPTLHYKIEFKEN